MIHVHRLQGCAPAPLAHYLKALGILRLVAEQADPDVRAWWERDHFLLATTLSDRELESFFLYRYQPTPLVSPWNRGSGFFKANDPGLSSIKKSTAARFKIFRKGIEASHALLGALGEADEKVRDIKAEAKTRSTSEHDVERARRGYSEDYEKLLSDRNKAREERDRIRDSENRDGIKKAEQRLENAEKLMQIAEDYEGLLDTRDKAEKRIRDLKMKKGVNGDERRIEERRLKESLKESLSGLKSSKNYERRLKEAETRFKNCKASLIPALRLKWRGAHREWMDAAIVLGDDGTPKFPSLLGTGGSDGRLDFTNNFMQRLAEVFNLDSEHGEPQHAAMSWISGSLWGIPVPGYPTGLAVGQYLPGTAGGANNSNGPDSDSIVNPIDFLLMLEGTVVFTSHAARRLGLSDSSRVAAPFAVNARGAGYASASDGDESARGEQWMPLWSHPSTFRELKHMLGEGRAQVGSRPAYEPLDLARAVARLGTVRGISGFQRYGYIERNGQSNLAVPLGRFVVTDQKSEHLACIDDLDSWLRHMHREARDQNAPTRLIVVERRLAEALFAATQHSDRPEFWQRILLQLAEVEEIMAHGSGYGAGLVPRLRPEWVPAVDDGTPEVRLALAFALQARGFRQEKPIDPVRRHWLPLDRKRPWRFATTGTGSGTRLDIQPEVVMQGRRGIDDAVAMIERRLIEASQRGDRHLPLKAAPRAATCTADLVELLSGSVDLDRTLGMARTLMALDRTAWAEQRIPIELPQTSDWPDDAWMAIRLCMLPWPLKSSFGSRLDIGADPAIVRRLAGGDAAFAIELALRRLYAVGVRCTVRAGTVPAETARRWVAALAFPITQQTAERFLQRLNSNRG